MTSQHHSIKRIQFNVHLPSADDAYEIQQEISDLFYRHIVGLLEDLFSRHVPPEQVFYFDRLTLDIGYLRVETWEEEFVEKLTQKLEEKLRDMVYQMETPTVSETPYFDSEPDQIWDNDEQVARLDTAQAVFDVLKHYLQTGTLPWMFGKRADDIVQQAEPYLSQIAEPLRVFLLSQGADSTARRRLALLLPESFLQKITRHWYPSQENALNGLKDALKQVLADAIVSDTARTRFEVRWWDLLWQPEWLQSPPPTLSPQLLATRFLQDMNQYGGSDQVAFVADLRRTLNELAARNPELSTLRHEIEASQRALDLQKVLLQTRDLSHDYLLPTLQLLRAMPPIAAKQRVSEWQISLAQIEKTLQEWSDIWLRHSEKWLKQLAKASQDVMYRTLQIERSAVLLVQKKETIERIIHEQIASQTLSLKELQNKIAALSFSASSFTNNAEPMVLQATEELATQIAIFAQQQIHIKKLLQETTSLLTEYAQTKAFFWVQKMTEISQNLQLLQQIWAEQVEHSELLLLHKEQSLNYSKHFLFQSSLQLKNSLKLLSYYEQWLLSGTQNISAYQYLLPDKSVQALSTWGYNLVETITEVRQKSDAWAIYANSTAQGIAGELPQMHALWLDIEQLWEKINNYWQKWQEEYLALPWVQVSMQLKETQKTKEYKFTDILEITDIFDKTKITEFASQTIVDGIKTEEIFVFDSFQEFVQLVEEHLWAWQQWQRKLDSEFGKETNKFWINENNTFAVWHQLGIETAHQLKQVLSVWQERVSYHLLSHPIVPQNAVVVLLIEELGSQTTQHFERIIALLEHHATLMVMFEQETVTIKSYWQNVLRETVEAWQAAAEWLAEWNKQVLLLSHIQRQTVYDAAQIDKKEQKEVVPVAIAEHKVPSTLETIKITEFIKGVNIFEVTKKAEKLKTTEKSKIIELIEKAKKEKETILSDIIESMVVTEKTILVDIVNKIIIIEATNVINIIKELEKDKETKLLEINEITKYFEKTKKIKETKVADIIEFYKEIKISGHIELLEKTKELSESMNIEISEKIKKHEEYKKTVESNIFEKTKEFESYRESWQYDIFDIIEKYGINELIEKVKELEATKETLIVHIFEVIEEYEKSWEYLYANIFEEIEKGIDILEIEVSNIIKHVEELKKTNISEFSDIIEQFKTLSHVKFSELRKSVERLELGKKTEIAAVLDKFKDIEYIEISELVEEFEKLNISGFSDIIEQFKTLSHVKFSELRKSVEQLELGKKARVTGDLIPSTDSTMQVSGKMAEHTKLWKQWREEWERRARLQNEQGIKIQNSFLKGAPQLLALLEQQQITWQQINAEWIKLNDAFDNANKELLKQAKEMLDVGKSDDSDADGKLVLLQEWQQIAFNLLVGWEGSLSEIDDILQGFQNQGLSEPQQLWLQASGLLSNLEHTKQQWLIHAASLFPITPILNIEQQKKLLSGIKRREWGSIAQAIRHIHTNAQEFIQRQLNLKNIYFAVKENIGVEYLPTMLQIAEGEEESGERQATIHETEQIWQQMVMNFDSADDFAIEFIEDTATVDGSGIPKSSMEILEMQKKDLEKNESTLQETSDAFDNLRKSAAAVWVLPDEQDDFARIWGQTDWKATIIQSFDAVLTPIEQLQGTWQHATYWLEQLKNNWQTLPQYTPLIAQLVSLKTAWQATHFGQTELLFLHEQLFNQTRHSRTNIGEAPENENYFQHLVALLRQISLHHHHSFEQIEQIRNKINNLSQIIEHEYQQKIENPLFEQIITQYQQQGIAQSQQIAQEASLIGKPEWQQQSNNEKNRQINEIIENLLQNFEKIVENQQNAEENYVQWLQNLNEKLKNLQNYQQTLDPNYNENTLELMGVLENMAQVHRDITIQWQEVNDALIEKQKYMIALPYYDASELPQELHLQVLDDIEQIINLYERNKRKAIYWLMKLKETTTQDITFLTNTPATTQTQADTTPDQETIKQTAQWLNNAQQNLLQLEKLAQTPDIGLDIAAHRRLYESTTTIGQFIEAFRENLQNILPKIPHQTQEKNDENNTLDELNTLLRSVETLSEAWKEIVIQIQKNIQEVETKQTETNNIDILYPSTNADQQQYLEKEIERATKIIAQVTAEPYSPKRAFHIIPTNSKKTELAQKNAQVTGQKQRDIKNKIRRLFEALKAYFYLLVWIIQTIIGKKIYFETKLTIDCAFDMDELNKIPIEEIPDSNEKQPKQEIPESETDPRFMAYKKHLNEDASFKKRWNAYANSFEKSESGLLYFIDPNAPKINTEQKTSSKLPSSGDPSELYIQNAGLVLLWIYLGYFFRDMKLTDKGKFVDKAAQHRAVHLLQYAATQRENEPEHQLPLTKILCGIPVTEFVETPILLTEEEKQGTEKLIASAIKNWTALKTTSVEGYQEAFIRREGRLTHHEDGWHLLVEQRPYDMLLQQLPYSISMIRQAWMRDNIWIEWT